MPKSMAGFFQRIFFPKTDKKDGNFVNRKFSGLLPEIFSPFFRFTPSSRNIFRDFVDILAVSSHFLSNLYGTHKVCSQIMYILP